MTQVALLVEGVLDAHIGGRVIIHAGMEPGVVYGRQGWTYIRERVQGFNQASDGNPMLAIVDLMDTGIACAATLVNSWIAHRRPNMILRVARPEIESWLLADRDGFARFLGIRPQHVPNHPDDVPDAKAEVMRLASRCRNQRRRAAIVPRDGYSASEGPLYTAELGIFVSEDWDINAASTCSPSLRSALRRLAELGLRLRTA
jgi:hypothetical protein